MNKDLYQKMYTILAETFEESGEEYLHAMIDVALNKIEPLIDEYAKSFYEEGYEDRKRDENYESRTNIIKDTPNEK
jgi:hypothetical protein